MVVELFLDALAAVASFFFGLLPEASGSSPTPPDVTPMMSILADLNSVMPVAPLVAAGVFVLAFLVPMIAFRLILLVRHILLP